MATRRKPTKKRPTKPPRKRRQPRTEEDVLADELMRDDKSDQSVVAPSWAKYIKELRRRGQKPIGALKLQELGLKEGIDPNKNEFSRGIIEMREE